MTTTFRRWRQSCRYHATLRELRALSPHELRELLIHPADVERVARAATRL